MRCDYFSFGMIIGETSLKSQSILYDKFYSILEIQHYITGSQQPRNTNEERLSHKIFENTDSADFADKSGNIQKEIELIRKKFQKNQLYQQNPYSQYVK